MILLITFIAHHLLKYINSRLNKSSLNTTQSFNEPELFLFNESFDANLLNLKRKSISSLQDDDSFELMKNLNKLYTNENIQFENESICAMDSFDIETNNHLESMEVSDYMDLDDSVFNTILFDDTKNEDSLLTESKIYRDKNLIQNLCYSLGNFEKSSSLTSFSSTPCSTKIRSKISKTCISFKLNESYSKNKKFRSRIERLKHTKNFYRRRQRTSSLNVHVNLNETVCFQVESPKVNNYKPSFKVEKLLNDSRGMKKYLIDYDFLMSHQRKRKNTVSLNNMNSLMYQDCESISLLSSSSNSISSIELDVKENNDVKLRGALFLDVDDKENSIQLNLPSSNRCSSGYLSDC